MRNYFLHLLYLLTPILAFSLQEFPNWAARHFKTSYFTFSSHVSPASNNIPQFILDANHSWISDNRPRLERYADIASALCNPDSSLWMDLKPPPDLFHDLEIDNNRAGINRDGWPNAIDRLGEMLACPKALNDARVLNVDIFYSESTFPPSELPVLFAEALRRMRSLESLKWGISAKATQVFEKEFARQNLTLPSVRCLVPGKYSDYLVRMCPGLMELRAGGYHHWSWKHHIKEIENDADLLLMRSAGAAEGLKILEFDPSKGEGWSPDFLEEIRTHIPNLITLRMNGRLGVEHMYDSYYFQDEIQWGQRGAILQKYLDILTRFPRLEYLHLPSSADLDLGFDGGHWCGNAYFGANGRRYGRQVVKQAAEATEFAGDMVVKTLPNLKGFSIGDVASITHGNEGLPQVSWPWTGRMEEYALEKYPL